MEKKRSLILKYFTPELYLELFKLTMMNELDNNSKGIEMLNLLRKFNVPFSSLGSGTNRYGIMIEEYAVKIALDKDGMIDNRREMLYSKDLYPDVVKVYECVPNGLIAVFEYVTIFTVDDFYQSKTKMKEILDRISSRFLVGDVGVNSKNYGNWGLRDDGSLCILDFAYIYDVAYKLFRCNCDNLTLLNYDKDFVNIQCPKCGRKYEFKDIRKRITKAAQEEEIGDIRRLGYNLHKPEEEVEHNPDFVPYYLRPRKKKVSEDEERLRTVRKMMKIEKRHKQEQDWD